MHVSTFDDFVQGSEGGWGTLAAFCRWYVWGYFIRGCGAGYGVEWFLIYAVGLFFGMSWWTSADLDAACLEVNGWTWRLKKRKVNDSLFRIIASTCAAPETAIKFPLIY